MNNSSAIRIDLDRLLMFLFYVYAFSLPFELILEILFEIDTILKPFRAISLLIIGVFLIRTLIKEFIIKIRDRNDLLLYLVFIYGILISMVRIMTGVFNFGLFYNDLFQFGLLVTTYFVFKSLPVTKDQMMILLRCFLAGLILNSAYIFFEFVFLGHHGRQSGFTDNPNYGALGLVTGITYLLLKIPDLRKYLWRIIYGILVLFLLYIFIIAGSRTGLIILLLSSIVVFYYYSFRRKIVLLILGSLLAIVLIPKELDNARLGGGPLILLTRVTDNINTETEDVRFIVWRGVFRVLEGEGYAGMGIGQFKASFPRYFSEEPNKLILEMVNRGYFLSTHNDYLAILTDYGLPSLLLYLFFLALTLRKVFRRLLTYPLEDDQERLLYRFTFIMICCLMVFGLAAENFQHQLFWFILMFSTKDFLIPEPQRN